MQAHAEVSTLRGVEWDGVRVAWMLKKTPGNVSQVQALNRRYNVDRSLPIQIAGDPLWEYQMSALYFGLAYPSILLDMYMATGKTRTALELVRVYNANRVLILGPLQAGGVWRTQIERYYQYPHKTLVVNSSQSVARRAVEIHNFLVQDTPGVSFVFVNYESAWRSEMSKRLLSISWDLIIADECHRLKAPGSRISMFVSKLAPHVPFRLGLSGTPLPRSIVDAYGIYRFLQPSIFGRNFQAFKNRYVIEDPFTRQEVGYPHTGEFQQKYNLIRFYVPRRALRIEQPLFTVVPVSLQGKLWEHYSKLERDFVVELENGATVDAPNVLVKYLRLQQIESGFITDDGETAELVGGDAKFQVLRSFLEDFPVVEPLVVFARFRHEINQIYRCAESLGRPCYRLTGEHKELEKWENDQGAVLAVNLGAGSEAIDLTHASYAVFYSLSLRLSEFEQAIARVNRPGQRRKPAVYFFLPEGPGGEVTIGQRLYHAHRARRSLLDYLVDGEVTSQT